MAGLIFVVLVTNGTKLAWIPTQVDNGTRLAYIGAPRINAMQNLCQS